MNEHKHNNCRPSFHLAMLYVPVLVSLSTVLLRCFLLLATLGHVLNDEIEDHVCLYAVHRCHLVASFSQYLVGECSVLGLLEQYFLLHSKEIFATNFR